MHEAKGYKSLTKLTLYVNNKQDMDIAEMRNNWALWQKVVDLPIDVSQKTSFAATLPLPVTATNILIEYHSVNLSKPVELNSRKQPGKYSSAFNTENFLAKPSEDANSPEVEGLDSVLSLLPREISAKFCSLSAGVKCIQGDVGGHVKISMTCPRCGTNVNNSHGNCNNCGENAM